jgi:hypothetical protein
MLNQNTTALCQMLNQNGTVILIRVMLYSVHSWLLPANNSITIWHSTSATIKSHWINLLGKLISLRSKSRDQQFDFYWTLCQIWTILYKHCSFIFIIKAIKLFDIYYMNTVMIKSIVNIVSIWSIYNEHCTDLI